MKYRTLGAFAVGAALFLSGCAAASEQTAGNSAPERPAASSLANGPGEATVAAQQLLARHGLAGADVRTVIAKLEATHDDRDNGLVGSVRPHEVQLSDKQGQAVLPIPEGQFYLSMAPYLRRTHDCFNHNLATCQGELTDTPMKVTVTGSDGRTLFDQDVKTAVNGFTGVWLPSNIKATVSITHQDKTVTSPISTGPKDPTCLTTLKLV